MQDPDRQASPDLDAEADYVLSPEEVEKALAIAAIPEDEFKGMLRKARESGDEFTSKDFARVGRARRKPAESTELSRSETAYRACSIKRARRTKADVEAVRAAIYSTLRNDHPMTQRQLFYRLVSRGVVAKTEAQYQTTVIRLSNEMRLAGQIEFGWIADNTRWMRKPKTHSSLEEALSETARTYRRSVWDDQDAYVEIWLEKDALAGVLIEVTTNFGSMKIAPDRADPGLWWGYDAESAGACDRGEFHGWLASPDGVFIDFSAHDWPRLIGRFNRNLPGAAALARDYPTVAFPGAAPPIQAIRWDRPALDYLWCAWTEMPDYVRYIPSAEVTARQRALFHREHGEPFVRLAIQVYRSIDD
jgi:hypothetical protein